MMSVRKNMSMLLELWNQEKSIQEIADEMDVPKEAIRSAVRRHRDVFGYRSQATKCRLISRGVRSSIGTPRFRSPST